MHRTGRFYRRGKLQSSNNYMSQLYALADGCDAVLNAWCDKNCPHVAEHGSLLARYDWQFPVVPGLPKGWRCYARSTLDEAQMHYQNQLKSVLVLT